MHERIALVTVAVAHRLPVAVARLLPAYAVVVKPGLIAPVTRAANPDNIRTYVCV